MSRLIDADAVMEQGRYAHLIYDDGKENLGYTFVVFGSVIKNATTVYASPVVWHKVTTRPLTEEETAYYAEMGIEGIEYIFDCEMPEDGQEILVATKWGVDKDICCNDMDYGVELESRGDWDGVYAWAEMPKYEEAE